MDAISLFVGGEVEMRQIPPPPFFLGAVLRGHLREPENILGEEKHAISHIFRSKN